MMVRRRRRCRRVRRCPCRCVMLDSDFASFLLLGCAAQHVHRRRAPQTQHQGAERRQHGREAQATPPTTSHPFLRAGGAVSQPSPSLLARKNARRRWRSPTQTERHRRDRERIRGARSRTSKLLKLALIGDAEAGKTSHMAHPYVDASSGQFEIATDVICRIPPFTLLLTPISLLLASRGTSMSYRLRSCSRTGMFGYLFRRGVVAFPGNSSAAPYTESSWLAG